MKNILRKQTVFVICCLTLLFIPAIFRNSVNASELKENSDGKNIPEKRYRFQVFDSLTVSKDIFFAEVKNENDSLINLKLDVYQPHGDKQKNRPVILWVHGGGFRGGTKEQGYIVKLARAFAKRGYVSVSTDYRVRKNPRENMRGTVDDAVNDVMEAFSWIKKNGDKYGINKNQITIGGGSAGGILSTNLCYLDSDTNNKWNKDGLIAFINLWGSPDKDRFYVKLDKNDPPTILIHGKNDTTVPYKNCLWLSNKLRKTEVKYEVFVIEGAGHTPVDHLDEIEEKISEFLYGILDSEKQD